MAAGTADRLTRFVFLLSALSCMDWGEFFLVWVRSATTDISDKMALPDDPDQVANRFLLQQWRGIEEVLVERGTRDTCITAVNEGSGLAATPAYESEYW